MVMNRLLGTLERAPASRGIATTTTPSRSVLAGINKPIVLLCGMPRSGTTWIGKIFDSHPDTFYLHEPDSVYRLAGLPTTAEIGHAEIFRPVIEGYVHRLMKRRSTKVVGSLPIFPKSYFSPYEFALMKTLTLGAKAVGKLVGEVGVPSIRSLEHIPHLQLVWKSIESTLAMGTITKVIPGRGILILRHPCGYITSVLRGESRGRFSESCPTAEDYGMYDHLARTEGARRRGLTLDALYAMAPIDRLAWRWTLANEKAMEDMLGLGNATHVLYEDVCKNPFDQVRRLFEFTGLRWDTQTERFIRASTGRDNPAYYSVFKDPQKSANAWRNELDPATVRRIMSIAEQSSLGALYSG